MHDDAALQALRQLYDELAERTRALDRVHADRLQCGRGCSACCVDDITVFEIEAQNIRTRFESLLREETPHPHGACAFLDGEGACRVYDARPYVCRTQGYPLRWIDDADPDHPVERRDICPLNETNEPIEALPEADCWTLGPFEGRLAVLQQRYGDGALRRVPLRAMFDE
jgi:hypothetical protein